jgi:hypothetical protein
VEDPNQIIIQGEFSSPEGASSFRERLLSSDVIDRAGAKLGGPPMVVKRRKPSPTDRVPRGERAPIVVVA